MERQKQIEPTDKTKKRGWMRHLPKFATGGLIAVSGVLGAYETTHAQTDPCQTAINSLSPETQNTLKQWIDPSEKDTYPIDYFQSGITDSGRGDVVSNCRPIAEQNNGYIPDSYFTGGDWIAPPTVVPQMEAPTTAPLVSTAEAPVAVDDLYNIPPVDYNARNKANTQARISFYAQVCGFVTLGATSLVIGLYGVRRWFAGDSVKSTVTGSGNTYPVLPSNLPTHQPVRLPTTYPANVSPPLGKPFREGETFDNNAIARWVDGPEGDEIFK